MAIFDRFRRKQESPQIEGNTQEAAAAVKSSLDLTEAPPAPSQLETNLGLSSDDAAKFYNPYEGLGAALDRRDLVSKGGFRLPKEPEFLFSEEALVHRRSWSENLTYYTGLGYLSGALLGGGAGAYQSVAAPVAIAGVQTTQRLRLNQLLNTSGKLGRSAGNSLGILGLLFASFESLYGYVNDGFLPDESATLGAGATTGALYRSVRGPRQAAAAGAIGLVAASSLLAGRRYINKGL